MTTEAAREKYVFTMALYCFFASLAVAELKLGQNIHKKRDPAVNHKQILLIVLNMKDSPEEVVYLGHRHAVFTFRLCYLRVRGLERHSLVSEQIDKNQATSSQLTNHRKQV